MLRRSAGQLHKCLPQMPQGYRGKGPERLGHLEYQWYAAEQTSVTLSQKGSLPTEGLGYEVADASAVKKLRINQWRETKGETPVNKLGHIGLSVVLPSV